MAPLNKIQIETAQNVTIAYGVASVGDRILAYLLDTFLVFTLLIGLAALISLVTDDQTTFLILFLPLLVGAILYHFLCELTMDGQSLGKKALRIKVVRLDGMQPGLGAYLLRWLLRVVDIQLFSGAVAIVTIVVNGKGQRLGDLAAGTCVVKLNPPTALGETLYRTLDDTYEVAFPEADRLSDDDAATIRDVIAVCTRNGLNRRTRDLAAQTKAAVESKTGIRTGTPPLPFLQTILKDYNVLMGRLD